jgi:site-specific DNA-methyltransferase (adenine-specific)
MEMTAMRKETIGNCELYCGDCLDILPTLGTVDAVVTSPPYDNLRTYEGIQWDFDVFKGVANNLYPVIKDGGVIVWVVGDSTVNGSETASSFRQALYFKELGLRLHDTMIYQKNGVSYPSVNRYYAGFEYMFVFSKGRPRTVNLIADKKNKKYGQIASGTDRRNDGSFKIQIPKPYKQYGVRSNVWKYNAGYMLSSKDKIAFEHPAIFPEKLAMDHIKSWSNEADTILDPFMGSGTTGVACIETGRKFIGIEISEKYFDIACRRIENAYNQGQLFNSAG